MKQRLTIISLVFLGLVALLALSAISYVQRDVSLDKENLPNRSSYNSGATGTKAFYQILLETGIDVTRWQKPIKNLFSSDIKVFIIVEPLLVELNDKELEELLEWISRGNKLILISREPNLNLLNRNSNWQFILNLTSLHGIYDVDPYNPIQMTHNTPAIKPSYPTSYTKNIIAIQPSRFASRFYLSSKAESFQKNEAKNLQSLTAPIVHFADKNGAVLINTPYDRGEIVLLSDPYIVSNGGIRLADNLQLALNLVERYGKVAFDEYHHGYGSAEIALISYFQGTPFLAMLLQAILIAVAVIFSQSQRFARPLPLLLPNRSSKLEYVSAVADLQQKAKAYDLAVENVYLEFRRRVCNLFGLDPKVKPEQLAQQIRLRIKLSDAHLEETLIKCQKISQGHKVEKKEALRLVSKLKEIEESLGIKRHARKLKI